ncbi:hypothetical protein NPIL_661221 [Nephila pilipes]|uniref:Uncharacterized protein n=1 Tax=Nephila pilipes TaxID=299642 RepID=A0A8X6QBF0_NEPPI|nr:hypothetical protein NPIL_661221 [Nephila pilipes]
MGRIPKNKFDNRDSLMDISLLINEGSASNLCNLDVLVITDPVESKIKFEKLEQTIRFFEDIVTRDPGGRGAWEEGLVIPSSLRMSAKRVTKKACDERDSQQQL